MSGARYEISIDGVVRTHRDLREIAVEAATFLKLRNPPSRVVVRDLITGTKTEISSESTATKFVPSSIILRD
jgi:hypothetical protein